MRHIILATFVLAFSSCATIFNSKKTNLTVITSVPSNLILDKDTIKNASTSKSFSVERDKKPLIISVYNDNLTKTVIVKSKNSFAYWLNAYPNWHLWIGFYIDTKTKKRYTYPKTIYIDFASKDSTFLTYVPLDNPYNKYSNIFKFTPSKIVGLINPSIELCYERKTSQSLSTQIMASYLLPISVMDLGNNFRPKIKGFRVSIEEKFYIKKSSPMGPYLSFEINYLNNKYKDIWSFGEKNIYSNDTVIKLNYLDTFSVTKQTYSFNLKIGFQKIIKRFSFDVYAGIGLRYKDVRHFDKIKPDDKMLMPRHPNITYITNFEGKYWTFCIPMNMKLGYTF